MNNLSLKFKTLVSTLMLAVSLANPLSVLAIEPPPALTPPAPLSAPEATLTPPPALTPPTALTPPPTLTPPPAVTPQTAPQQTEAELQAQAEEERRRAERREARRLAQEEAAALAATQTVTNTNNTDNSLGGNVGDTTINTGDGNSSILAANNANNNFASTGGDCFGCSGGGASVTNTGNGADSTNTGATNTTNSTDFDQTNDLNLLNDFSAVATTGETRSDSNVGNTSITTGDANVVVTAVNFGNNNGINTTYQEFNVYDNQTGDINFNFADPSLAGGMFLASNEGNGDGSYNTATNNSTNTTDIDQANTVDATNDIYIVAETGDNSASRNTGGNNTIDTGDANVSANLINFFNNNIVAGAEFLIGVVNIYGTLEGDIILPHDIENASCTNCGGDTLAMNTGNGADSVNSASNDVTNTNTINQTNDGTIVNNLDINATTGDNSTSRNTGGNNSITTGDVDLSATTVNSMNNNVVSSDGEEVWWLVLVNNMGNWIGKIVGADGQTVAGSDLQFSVAPDGSIQAINSGNGTFSDNLSSNSVTNTTTIDQTNQANVVNNLTIDANTGGNQADRNTGGNSTITTGDVNVAGNIVNFINNNFVGKKFMIAIVNIFGTLVGDIIPPDQPIPSDVDLSAALINNPASGGPAVSTTGSTTTGGANKGGSNQALATLPKLGGPGTGSSTSNDVTVALGNSENTKVLGEAISRIPLEQALKRGFTLNYGLLTMALLALVGLTLAGRVLFNPDKRG